MYIGPEALPDFFLGTSKSYGRMLRSWRQVSEGCRKQQEAKSEVLKEGLVLSWRDALSPQSYPD